ncbi:MAG TPA: PEP-CTERM sorting domain-containing protein [Roseiarcus sp.]|nr:PEP-CTERM sorting domain-containing protein [Roseiarcus sp.]
MLKTISAAALAAAGAFAFMDTASADDTIVSTIDGCYDCSVYDTPSLTFHNTSGGSFINATIFLHGYQGLNNGQSVLVNLGVIGPGDTIFTWGFLPGFENYPNVGPAGSLTSYDYDDTYAGTPYITSDPNCTIDASLCALVGNFSVTLNATISGGDFDGQAITSFFSPTTNYTGGFVGWEGLDPNGLSETAEYDTHVTTVGGTLAVITLGTTAIPEPSTWAMMLSGFAGLGFAGFRAKKRASSLTKA